jgi:hypothetical protein
MLPDVSGRGAGVVTVEASYKRARREATKLALKPGIVDESFNRKIATIEAFPPRLWTKTPCVYLVRFRFPAIIVPGGGPVVKVPDIV